MSRHLPALATSLAIAVGGLALHACFEEGALDLSPGTTEDSAVATTDTAVTSEPPDTVTSEPPDTVTSAPTDTGAPTDTVSPPTDATPTDTSVADATSDTTGGDADVVLGPPCLTDSDCGGQSTTGNLCDGVIACVDYRCRFDPETIVTCETPTDPCTTSACEPTTGVCSTTQICSCDPVATLACGSPLVWTTGEAGTTDHLSGYGCGAGGAGAGPERTFSFQVTTPQRVRLSLAGPSGAAEGVFVVPYQGDCQAGGCVAHGTDQILFDPAGGTPYAIVVEEDAPGQVLTLTADCGITRETRCSDGLDDDGDGETDCDDLDCDGIDGCFRPPDTETGLCFDGVDNDLDSHTDCGDTDCHGESGCLQTCQPTSVFVGCNFSQGLGIGGGSARSTNYACGPDFPGKEVVYRFVAPGTGPVTVTMSSGSSPYGLFLLEERGQGCTPLHCLQYGPNVIDFTAIQGKTYYFAIDSPEGFSANYFISVSCDL